MGSDHKRRRNYVESGPIEIEPHQFVGPISFDAARAASWWAARVDAFLVRRRHLLDCIRSRLLRRALSLRRVSFVHTLEACIKLFAQLGNEDITFSLVSGVSSFQGIRIPSSVALSEIS